MPPGPVPAATAAVSSSVSVLPPRTASPAATAAAPRRPFSPTPQVLDSDRGRASGPAAFHAAASRGGCRPLRHLL